MEVNLAIEHLAEAGTVSDGAEFRVSMVHGFTQNAQCLGVLAAATAEAFASQGRSVSVLGIDAPGHGASANDRSDLIDAARLIIEAGGRGHYVGYSMGGRMLLHAALLFPDQIESLTLIGATPGIEDAIARATRVEADELLAMRLESEELVTFLDDWLALPLFDTLPLEAACRSERLLNRPEGLAASLRICGTGNQFPLWHLLGSIELPVQVIAGRADKKFTAIGERMADDLPDGTFCSVDGGHAVHSERPAEVADLISDFAQRSAG